MSLKALQDLIEANPEALAKVKSAANHAEISQIAKGYGIEVTPAEVMKYAAQQTAELDDDALEAVAGGAWGETPQNRDPVYDYGSHGGTGISPITIK